MLSFFFSSLQSLVCLHNLICHNTAIVTSRFCVDWRFVGILILFFPHSHNSDAAAIAKHISTSDGTHNHACFSKAPHQTVQSAKSYINILTLFSCFVPRNPQAEVSFQRFLCDTRFLITGIFLHLHFNLIPLLHW